MNWRNFDLSMQPIILMNFYYFLHVFNLNMDYCFLYYFRPHIAVPAATYA